MDLYLAGTPLTIRLEAVRYGVMFCRLLSYIDPYRVSRSIRSLGVEVTDERYKKAMTKKNDFPVSLFLDSGAFSAWSRGATIDIQEYISFIKEHKKRLKAYAVLDVIGDAEATWQNQLIMEKAGLMPVPCFHFGEPFKYLQRYVDKYKYIAIGGLARMGTRKTEMFGFLDKCFSLICDKDGMPKVKTHGFAVTGMYAMKRYPWYSVDSTSWIVQARLGCIYVPYKLPNGEWDYLETLPKKVTRLIAVSSVSPSTVIGVQDQHFINISKQWQKEVLEITKEYGFSMGISRFKKVKAGYELGKGERWVKSPGIGECQDEDSLEFGEVRKGKAEKQSRDYVEIIDELGLCNDYTSRDVFNAKYFNELQNRFPKYPWAWQGPSMTGFGF